MPASTEDRSGSTPDLPADVIEDLLSADRRRHALAVLVERDDAVALEDLAAAVLARERGRDPESIGPDERRRVREEFFQHHLPKLTATGVVEYDSMLGTVAFGDQAALADALPEG